MNHTSPRLTIGLPVRNGERYLAEALDSLIAQTVGDFELLISDNASTDSTRELCRAYAARDPRIRLICQGRNLGAARNYNLLVDLARGEYFKWAAHDDRCDPHMLAACIQVLDEHPEVVLVYPQTVVIDAAGRPLRRYPDDLELRDLAPHRRYRRFHQVYRAAHSCNPVFGVMRLEVLRCTARIGSFVSADMLLLGELALYGQFWEIPHPLFFRRDHPEASVRVHPGYRERQAWFDPQKGGVLQLTRWIWLREYLAAIRRAPLSASERTRCARELIPWLSWNGRGLGKDLGKAALWPILRKIPVKSKEGHL